VRDDRLFAQPLLSVFAAGLLREHGGPAATAFGATPQGRGASTSDCCPSEVHASASVRALSAHARCVGAHVLRCHSLFPHVPCATPAEVALSKFFPAGFMWQVGAVLTLSAGYSSHSALQYFLTGLGDCLGVFIGHSVYKMCLHHVFRMKTVNVRLQVEVAAILAGSSFFSGAVWSPALNVCQGAKLHFWLTFAIVGAVCAAFFFCAIRVMRVLLPKILPLKEYAKEGDTHLALDFLLAVGVFGSSALFVSTNVTYPDDPFQSFLGIVHDKSLYGMVRAGMSTAIGFTAILTVQNLVLPATMHWLDPPSPPEPEPSDPLLSPASQIRPPFHPRPRRQSSVSEMLRAVTDNVTEV